MKLIDDDKSTHTHTHTHETSHVNGWASDSNSDSIWNNKTNLNLSYRLAYIIQNRYKYTHTWHYNKNQWKIQLFSLLRRFRINLSFFGIKKWVIWPQTLILNSVNTTKSLITFNILTSLIHTHIIGITRKKTTSKTEIIKQMNGMDMNKWWKSKKTATTT